MNMGNYLLTVIEKLTVVLIANIIASPTNATFANK